MFTFFTRKMPKITLLYAEVYYYLLSNLCFCATAGPHGDNCPSSGWSAMCRPCCEYHVIQCQCPSDGSKVGYTVPCCRNALDECDPCIIHPGCSLFENCKTCHNGTWKANDDFFINGKYCTECREGWSGGNCRTCGGFIQRAHGHIAMETYPINARCEWRVTVDRDKIIELSFSRLSLEWDQHCGYDYVEVRDGGRLSSPVIGRFCGDRLPAPIRSSGNSLHILFSSDGYKNFDGFVLTFQQRSERDSTVPAIEDPVCAPPEKVNNGYIMPVYGPKEEFLSVTYRCHQLFTLRGSQRRVCQRNGTWSGTMPTCIKGQTSVHGFPCSSPAKILNGFHRAAPDTDGGLQNIEFFCRKSHILSGIPKSTCQSNGTWSSRPPKCVKACREPKVSELVRQSVVESHLPSRHDMHDLLSAGFIPLNKLSKREDVSSTPVDLSGGFHPVQTSIEYRCASALYTHTGSSRRTCLRSGRWSGRHVSCSPVCGKFDAFGPRNFTGAQWPWHAAVYIRSTDTASTHRTRGTPSLSVRQGASESGSWSLVCSGALITQHSVVVSAQCVWDKDKRQSLSPEQVKVSMGGQHQASRGRPKSLKHLRVSHIVVHPKFHSSPDFDVAVLKLKDKAKISEHVLPVCLPKVQGGEVTVHKAYNSRWILPQNPYRHPDFDKPSSQTDLVDLDDIAQCEREFLQDGKGPRMISDNKLCVLRKQSSPQRPCPSLIPGITTVPHVVLSAADASEGKQESNGAASTEWQLLSLESLSSEEENCHQSTYTVQTRIANFRDWIEKNKK